MKTLFALLGASAMIGFAAPAHAGTPAGSGPDGAAGDSSAFLSSLQAAGITYRDAGQAVTAAQTLCALVSRGEPGLEAIGDLKANNPGFTTDGATKFASLAARSYCPEQLGPAAAK